ncbi:hypothetical protein Bca101_010701 [Brassica carinata]
MRISYNGDAMGGRAAGTGGGRKLSAPVVDKEVDYANYFCTYSFLYHQKDMLSDRVRMDAYFNAVFENKHHFAGKTVLDVGTGSGILAIWSAQAGARKVYAVEATKMADHARALVKANNLEHVVEVTQGSAEDISLPEKVDVIISEWMGYFLLRESMFDSVICARDQLDVRNKWAKIWSAVTAMWNDLNPLQVIGTPTIVKEMDCLTATVSEIEEVRCNVTSVINGENTKLCGFGGWFDVPFRGRKEDPAQQEIELTTAPSEQHCTHWGQQVFIMSNPINVEEGDNLNLGLVMSRSKQKHRLMEVELECEIKEASGNPKESFKKTYFRMTITKTGVMSSFPRGELCGIQVDSLAQLLQ